MPRCYQCPKFLPYQSNVFFTQQVFALLVSENGVDAADIVATQIRAKHDAVGRVAAKRLLVGRRRQQLDVAARAEAVILLFVLGWWNKRRRTPQK